jgi:hypothetical protein
LCLGPLFWFCCIAAVLGLGHLCHFCFPSLSNVSSWTSIVSQFSVHYCLWLVSGVCVFPQCHFHTVGHPYYRRGELLLWSTVFLGPILLTSFLFHHATFAQWDTFLQAAAEFLLVLLFPRVLSFRFWWCSAARFQTLHHFLGPLTDLTETSSLGIS